MLQYIRRIWNQSGRAFYISFLTQIGNWGLRDIDFLEE